MRNGHVFRQVLWEPAISGTAGGLLPTPTTQDTIAHPNAIITANNQRLSRTGSAHSLNLQDALTLPTPRTCSAMASTLDTAGNADPARFPNLETVIGQAVTGQNSLEKCSNAEEATLLPTPCTTDFNDASYHHPPCAGNTRGEKLAWAVGKHLGHNNGATKQRGETGSILTGAATYLNPSFVEEMMGFPVGWTV